MSPRGDRGHSTKKLSTPSWPSRAPRLTSPMKVAAPPHRTAPTVHLGCVSLSSSFQQGGGTPVGTGEQQPPQAPGTTEQAGVTPTKV